MPRNPIKHIQLPEPLFPREDMRPNEPCWCQSGRKWKRCHKFREKQEPASYYEEEAKIRREFARGYCSHPDAPIGCSDKIIRSHTLQNSGALSRISENNHVLSAKAAVYHSHKNDGKLVPRKTGVNLASTFAGFCSWHDNSMFLPIERGEIPLNKEAAFLLSFRAVAHELHQKKSGIAFMEGLRGTLDAGQPLRRQSLIQNDINAQVAGMKAALADLERWKEELDRRFSQHDYNDLRMCVIKFDRQIPAVASAAFQPEFDFSGRQLQSLMQMELEQIVFTLTYSGETSVAVFCWQDGANEIASRFVRSFIETPSDEQASRIVQTSFVHSENTHISPGWWATLSQQQKDFVSRLMEMGLPSDLRSAASLKYDPAMPKIEAQVASIEWS